MAASTPDAGPFRLHRLALAPLLPGASADTLRGALEEALAGGEAAFVDFLLANNLGPLWHEALRGQGLSGRLSAASQEALKAARLEAALRYMHQTATLRLVDRLFAERGVAYAAIKGAPVRELVYADPALRPSEDVDILVPAAQRVAAAEALAGAGCGYRPAPDNISHEATFVKDGLEIDLHWNTFRPGRSRLDMTDAFVARRARVGGFYGLSDTDAVFLMLTHPAFFKYVCSPNASLQRVADFALWTARRPVDWESVGALLEQAGLKAAAWSVLRWYAMLGLPVPEGFMAQIQPGLARRRYIEFWLERDLPTQWFWQARPLIQFGLTLVFHDRARDAARALGGILRARLSRRRDPFAHLRAPGA